jgi:hypothetical protein
MNGKIRIDRSAIIAWVSADVRTEADPRNSREVCNNKFTEDPHRQGVTE